MNDPTDLLDAVADATDRFLDAVQAHADLTAPSLLPDWSVAHVVAHVALNAEGFVRAADDRREGRLGVMYPGGVEGRARDIDDLAAHPRETLVARLTAANEAFLAAWRDAVPEGPCCTAVGLPEFSSSTVPLRRLREVEVHGADTGLGALDPDHWSEAYVGADLPTQWPSVALRTTEPVMVVDEHANTWSTGDGSTRDGPGAGSTGDAATVRVARRELLAWILDRGTVRGLPPLAPWGDQSRWHRSSP